MANGFNNCHFAFLILIFNFLRLCNRLHTPEKNYPVFKIKLLKIKDLISGMQFA
jgi:hypothetical protein